VWRVFEIWDSREALEAFTHGALVAAFTKQGISAQPKITTWPVHNRVG
jgi:hypothetical protein